MASQTAESFFFRKVSGSKVTVSGVLWRPGFRHIRVHRQTFLANQKRCLATPRSVNRISFPVLEYFTWCLAIASFATAASLYRTSVVHAEAPPSPSPEQYIRLDEVKKHGPDNERKWVIKGTRVYDITEWIPGHPGGEVILRAVGGTIDRYWDIFAIHKKQDVYDILESYFIGVLDPQDLVDGQVPQKDVDDPFVTDPQRSTKLLFHSERPCNAETPPDSLGQFVTPNDVFYIRNHLWVPSFEEDDLALQIELPDGTEKGYSMADLKSRFKPFTITATLQCSGNRRKHMTEESRSTNGLQWNVGAISNAEWTGIRLRDVLADAGLAVDNWDEEKAKHVQFMGNEAYGASIPIDKAVDRRGDVMLAFAMNGKPLPPDHGFPLRVMVPGTVAARSVKWVQKIVVSDEESSSQWQQRDYKCFGPNQGGKDVDWSAAVSIQEMPVQSAITSLRDIQSHSLEYRRMLQVYGLEEDAIRVEGYAFSGGGRAIVRVDVSADGGVNWHQATLLPDDGRGSKHWSWKRWEWIVPKRLAGRTFVVKAVDDSYNVQPESYEPHYNFRGNLTNGWHRVGYSRGI